MTSDSLDPLAPALRQSARQTFYRVVKHFEAADPYPSTPRPQRLQTYSQPRLVLFMHEYALSDESRDVFLRAFFGAVALAMDLDSNAALDFPALAPLFADFAGYLMDNFFLPMRALGQWTPQPTPASRSAVLRAQGGASPAENTPAPDDLSTLRGACFVRDRHRCVISRAFDIDEYSKRYEIHSEEACDDDGDLLNEQADKFDLLDVAHIFPYYFLKAGHGADMDAARETAFTILNMLDKDVVHMIDGADFDRPRNALTLNHLCHSSFSKFRVHFSPVPDQDHTYEIQSFLPPMINRSIGLPVTQTLCTTEDGTIEPPSPHLLAVHRAIAHIMHLSGAGDYITHVLRDIEDGMARGDGTSELGSMLRLCLTGWLHNGLHHGRGLW